METLCANHHLVESSMVWLNPTELCPRQWYVSGTRYFGSSLHDLSLVYLLCPQYSVKNSKYQCIRAVSSWPLDETYVKVNWKWFYLYRAIDKHGETLDIYFSPKRNRHATYEFLKRALKPYAVERQPKALNTDKHAAYGYVIARLINEGKHRTDVEQHQIKTLNNRIESDYAPIKKLIVTTGGFKSAKRAWSTI